MAKRNEITKDLLNKVLLESKRRCCICYEEGISKPIEGDIAYLHATPQSEANPGENLVFLCLNHHAKFDKGTLTADEVRNARDRLYRSLRQQDSSKDTVGLRYQRYEQKVVEILRKEMFGRFNDSFGFIVEARLDGRSGLKRLTDIAITLSPLGFPLLILVEIKYSTRGLHVGDVEAIASKFQDLGAAKGIIVCNSGFTPDAITRAKSLSIDLIQIVADTEDGEESSSDIIRL